MKKLKLYLDTSVISHLDAPDVPDRMLDTQRLWEEIKSGVYDVIISDVVIDEIMRCPQPKRNNMLAFLAEIDYRRVSGSDEIDEIAAQIIQLGVLKEKNRDDCIHMGTALASQCNYIVSWNFKHMVNVKTIRGIRAITDLFGYTSIDIVQPTMLVEKED